MHRETIPVPALPPMPLFPQGANMISTHISNNVRLLPVLNHIFDSHAKKMSIDRLITDPNTSPVWSAALENELGRLSNGFQNRVKPQNVMEFFSQRCLLPERLRTPILSVTLDH